MYEKVYGVNQTVGAVNGPLSQTGSIALIYNKMHTVQIETFQ